MKRFLHKLMMETAEITGMYDFWRKRKIGATALFYHGVENRLTDRRVQTVHIPFVEFENHIHYLRRNYEIVSMDYFYDCISNSYKMNPAEIILTFDDGFKNNLNVVMPFLKAYNIPFTVFICTNHIDTGKRFPTYYLHASLFYTDRKFIEFKSINRNFDISTDEKRRMADKILLNILKTISQDKVIILVKELIELIPEQRWMELDNEFSSDEPMNWEDVQKLHESGVIVGSHCHDHCILHSNQSLEEVEHQLKASKELIENKLGISRYFSYPNGALQDISFQSMKLVRESGYLLGFSTILGEIDGTMNQHILPRVGGEKDLEVLKFDLNMGFRYRYVYQELSLKFRNL
jgi:peptidoglycan/xylan/chitin deacetylase (PgdA/CDA1 family)